MNLLSNIESHPWKCLFIEILEKYCDAVMKLTDLFCEPWLWLLWEVTNEVDVQRKTPELQWLLKLLARSHQYLRVDNTTFSREANCPSYSQIETHSLTMLVFWWRVLSRMLLCSFGSTCSSVQFSHSVLSWLFVTPWTAAHQASLSITNSQSLLKLMSIESVMPSNHLILCHPLLLPPSVFPSIRVFSDESALRIRWPKYWSFIFNVSLSNEYQDWFPLGWTGWISLRSQGLSRVLSNTTVLKH